MPTQSLFAGALIWGRRGASAFTRRPPQMDGRLGLDLHQGDEVVFGCAPMCSGSRRSRSPFSPARLAAEGRGLPPQPPPYAKRGHGHDAQRDICCPSTCIVIPSRHSTHTRP